MKKIIFLLLTMTMLLLCSCSERRATGSENVADTIYTEPKAMSIHRNNPERALVMIDSAVIVGNITWQRGEYLRAVTQYGMNKYALARQTCLDLLDSETNRREHWPKDHGDSVTLERIYSLLVSIEYTSGNYPAIIRYATEASRLSHILDLPSEVGAMEGFIAEVMARTGSTEEGIDHLRSTINELRQIDSFQGVVPYHGASNKLLHILLDNGRFAQMVPLCEEVLERINELDEHPERFSGIAEGFDVSEFVDLARGQTLAFLTVAYVRQANEATGDSQHQVRAMLMSKAREAEAAVMRTKWSHTLGCDQMMSAAYHHLGEFQRFEEAMERMDANRTDTINANYRISLELRSEAAQLQGLTSKSLAYLQRASVIRDSLDWHFQQEQLNELATVYHLQEEQLARQEAEADARFYRLLTFAIIFGLIAAIAFAVYFFYKRRETARKNHVLAREIAEAITYKEKWESSFNDNPSSTSEESIDAQEQQLSTPSSSVVDVSMDGNEVELFQYLRDMILRDQLYLDAQLDRQKLVERFNLPKERIGAAFAKGSPYKSLIDFLTDCRLPYAAKLLAEQPDLPVADVALASGFPSADTFSRNFKQKYALTPSQFREQQEQS